VPFLDLRNLSTLLGLGMLVFLKHQMTNHKNQLNSNDQSAEGGQNHSYTFSRFKSDEIAVRLWKIPFSYINLSGKITIFSMVILPDKLILTKAPLYPIIPLLNLGHRARK
jgi:hypothetical protein